MDTNSNYLPVITASEKVTAHQAVRVTEQANGRFNVNVIQHGKLTHRHTCATAQEAWTKRTEIRGQIIGELWNWQNAQS
tara:strand:+ start:708 stop:944 length:237 start_codon:yes stop_codon:yes gene_type:complete